MLNTRLVVMPTHHTLLLSQGYQPVKIISWRRAMCMSFLGKVEVVSTHPGREVRTVSRSYPAPAVVRLVKHYRMGPQVVRFSRRNVYLRDRFICQYCQQRFSERELTLDHVVPRSQGGPTSWTNVVASCGSCNRKKGNRTPEQARMPLMHEPVKPSWLPPSAQLGLRTVPEVWEDWISSKAH